MLQVQSNGTWSTFLQGITGRYYGFLPLGELTAYDEAV